MIELALMGLGFLVIFKFVIEVMVTLMHKILKRRKRNEINKRNKRHRSY